MDTLDDNQKAILKKYEEELSTLIENMESDSIPYDRIKQIIQQGSKGYLKPIEKAPTTTIHYIEKTFPITLQDLDDLAKSQNLDPRDLKIIIGNNTNLGIPDYIQCAVLDQDIKLYAHEYKLTGPRKPKSKPYHEKR